MRNICLLNLHTFYYYSMFRKEKRAPQGSVIIFSVSDKYA